MVDTENIIIATPMIYIHYTCNNLVRTSCVRVQNPLFSQHYFYLGDSFSWLGPLKLNNYYFIVKYDLFSLHVCTFELPTDQR